MTVAVPGIPVRRQTKIIQIKKAKTKLRRPKCSREIICIKIETLKFIINAGRPKYTRAVILWQHKTLKGNK